jgi:indolepyruvate ferredoxin oxidoreductase
VWPLEPQGIARFAEGLDLIIVVEEKRSLIETQIREQLYGTLNAPVVIGKKDETGKTLFQAKGALEPNQIAVAIAERILGRQKDAGIEERLAGLRSATGTVRNTPDAAERKPYFCAGCPHNSSTVVPDGGRAYAGIGCHWMAQLVEGRKTEGFTQMGGEGANWIGEAPFSTRKHVFQNLGDGTYNHSGILAIRAAAAAGVNITYKILYNDAVAMTGGQPHEGGLTVSQIARQVAAEGAKRVVIVTDEPDKYPSDIEWPFGTQIHHRSELDRVQRELMDIEGLTVLIYDQTCAAEKRRRRKRGTFPDPDKRIVINELVCEGCGDCGVQSNCVAIVPAETEFGRKRQIDQSSCNKDYSCLKGFCPSFVTVKGGTLRKGKAAEFGKRADATLFEVLPEPKLPDVDRPYSIVVTGIGGTGVVTVGALIGMAAHLEGKGCGIIDMAGLAQKGGSVIAHLKVAPTPQDIQTIRVAAGGADLVLGCDLIVAASEKVLSTVRSGHTKMVVNSHEAMPADFTQNADYVLPSRLMNVAMEARAGKARVDYVEATRLATALTGNSIAANLFMLGFAWQKGTIPVSGEALDRAIELNGVAVEMNRQAFIWGRRAAHDLARVEALIAPEPGADDMHHASHGLKELVERRVAFLTDYQNAAYASRYKDLVDRVERVEAARAGGQSGLAEAVARYYFKLMAYKDEYEVARLYTDGSFERQVAAQFDGDYKLEFNLAPPILAKRDPDTGHLRKQTFGPWMMTAFRWLARARGLRGTAFDIFGYSQERRTERGLIGEYEANVSEIIETLTPDNHDLAVEIARMPERIRGYGHVKQRHLAEAKATEAALLADYRAGRPARKAVA